MTWSYAGYSDIGTRRENEDSYRVIDKQTQLCAVLSDGVGGHGGGKIAASSVTLTITEAFEKNSGECITEDKMIAVLNAANSEVHSHQTSQCRMQATCVSLWLDKKDNMRTAKWIHVGDSRLYCFYKGKPVSKTKDHSLQELWSSDPEKKNIEVPRSIIYQSIGGDEELAPSTDGIECAKGRTAFLLCSDGVWECMSDRKILYMLRRSKTPQQWIERISSAVHKSKNTDLDNNTAIAVFVDCE